MAKVTPELIRKLRELSGAGMLDCKQALEETDGDVDKAFTILREKGIAKAAKREGRETGQGLVEAYLHSTGDGLPAQVGVLVEERNVAQAKAEADGKPPQVIPKIVEGTVEQFLKQNCLLEQQYFREPKLTVQDLVKENISKLQENITIRRFARFNVREA